MQKYMPVVRSSMDALDMGKGSPSFKERLALDVELGQPARNRLVAHKGVQVVE
jgi:hypothetical protein